MNGMMRCSRCGAGNYAEMCTECGGPAGRWPNRYREWGIHWRYVKAKRKGSGIKLARHRGVSLPRKGAERRRTGSTRQPWGFRRSHG